MILGALIGSTIVLVYFTPYQGFISQPLIKLLYSILIVGMAFGFLKFRYFFKNLFAFYFITFMVGGGLFGLHYFFQTDLYFANGMLTSKTGGFGDPVSWLFVLIGFPLIWYFSKQNIDGIEVKKIQYEEIVNVQVDFGQDIIFLKGLIDSGNQLYDPLTRTPVMILDLSKAKTYLPSSIIDCSQRVDDFSFEEIDANWSHRIRLIPYRVVGMEQQFLLAIKPDKVIIHTSQEQIMVTKAFVGLNYTPLSSEGDFDCIIHPKMLIKNISA